MRRFSVFPRQRWTRVALLGALFGCYFGSLWVGARHFPHGYDWRRNVISNLLSPRDNPDWYWAPSAGVALAGLCMAPLALWMDRELGDGASALARRVRRPAFVVGIGCLILAALVAPQHQHTVMGMRRAHELLARTSAVGLGVGMLCACQSAGLRNGAAGERGRRLRGLRRIWQAATLLPALGAVGSGVMVALAHFGRLGTGVTDFFRGTVFWRLAFWEWVGSAAVFVFFASAVVMLGTAEEGSGEGILGAGSGKRGVKVP